MIFKSLSKKIDILIKEHRDSSKEVDTRLDNIEKVILLQEANLKAHMKRSDHLEEIVGIESDKRERAEKKMEKHVSMVEGALKLLGILGILVSIVAGISKILGLI